MMKETVHVAVISCSIMARFHMQAIKDHPDAELAMICDINEELLHETARELNVANMTTDYHDVLCNPDVDAVIIVTPDQTHKEIAIEALKAGKHVLCEKPLALTVEDCKAIVNAAEKSNKKFMVGQICRYTPSFLMAKDMIDRGEIGELFFVETEYAHDYSHMSGWRLDPLRHGFLGGGCHAVDLTRWIAGDPYEIMAYANHKVLKNWPTDDCTISIMRFPNDVIGKVFVSTGCKRDYTMRSVFYGSKGTIITDNTSPFVTVYKDGLGCGDSLFEHHEETYTIPVHFPVNVNNHNASGELQEFLDCIINDKPIQTTAMEGTKTVIASLAAVESTKTGMPIKIVYDL